MTGSALEGIVEGLLTLGFGRNLAEAAESP